MTNAAKGLSIYNGDKPFSTSNALLPAKGTFIKL